VLAFILSLANEFRLIPENFGGTPKKKPTAENTLTLDVSTNAPAAK
jgi:hypothetical protein